jgi:hypothetical protein
VAGNLELLVSDPNIPVSTADEVRIRLSLFESERPTPITHTVGIDHAVRI